jgi:hypothetical protein
MSVVVSGDGSPVSPETNIICGTGMISEVPCLLIGGGKRSYGVDGREEGGDGGMVTDMMAVDE